MRWTKNLTTNTIFIFIFLLFFLAHLPLAESKHKYPESNQKVGRLPLRQSDNSKCGTLKLKCSQSKQARRNYKYRSNNSDEDEKGVLSLWSIIALTMVVGFGLFYRIQMYVSHRSEARSFKNLVGAHIIKKDNILSQPMRAVEN